MKPSLLVRRGLSHYWRTHLAVVAGVAAAVTVLAGALLVGDSVRGSLRDLVLLRLGKTDLIVVSADFFRAQLAGDLRAHRDVVAEVTPLVAVQGVATEQASGRRASRVQVYGVGEDFWAFHGRRNVSPPRSREVLLSKGLAAEIGATPGATVLFRLQRPSDVPLESLHGRKDDLSSTLRLVVREVLDASDLGDFSVQPQQGDVLAAFAPLPLVQKELAIGERVNVLLVATPAEAGADRVKRLETAIEERATLQDLSLQVRALDEQGVLSVEADSAILDQRRSDAATQAARDAGMQDVPVFTYLASTIRSGDREIPYSLVTAIDLERIAPGNTPALDTTPPPIVLNEWAARDLGVKPGAAVTLDFLVWEDPGQLVTRRADFRVAAVTPLQGAAADRRLAPEYPGITGSETLRDWDPPFEIDLSRIRRVDEDYWRDHGTTPKAFIPLRVGQDLWKSRYGSLTSVRIVPPAGTSLDAARDAYATRLRALLDPLDAGIAVRDVRREGLDASRGATNFGEYFTYFSFFLVVSALLLAALFFKLGVEGRSREVGLLRAVGLGTPQVRRLFLVEGLALSVVGSLLGVAGAIAYGEAMMTGLRTWWVDAVGTTSLTLHLSPLSLAAGAVGGVTAALVCIWWTLRSLSRITERGLLAGQLSDEETVTAGARSGRAARARIAALAFGATGLLLMVAAGLAWLPREAAFFGAGGTLLVACLFAIGAWLATPARSPITADRRWAASRLGVRNAAYRPARSVLAIAVMAAATFILISVDAFRRDDRHAPTDRHSGTGGYALLVETVLPLVHDPNSPAGRELLGLPSSPDLSITPFRVLPGDDASCLNLYAPTQPRIIAASGAFVREGRFAFGPTDARTDEERQNPWTLLDRPDDSGAIPVIGDANSLSYVLHKAVGDEIVVERGTDRLRLRVVAALSDSMLQGELVMSEANFLRTFPAAQGYRLLLVDAPLEKADEIASTIEDRLGDLGADAVRAPERLASFHRVENTYLSTFQTLGGLGLLLGTVGLAAVLLRNVLERRRELALLGAVGYPPRSITTMVVAESALLLVLGLATGTVCALLAIAPAAWERGGRLPTGAGTAILLFAVLGTGLVSSIVATRAATRSRLLDALRAE